jgi:hypothetical protein
MWRKYVRRGDSAALECQRQNFGVDPVGFPAVLTDPEPPAAGRIDEHDLVAPASK